MNFALLGGDDRMARLARLLREAGHMVRPFALEAALPDCAATAAEALAGAGALVLPIPAERGGALVAPFSKGSYHAASLLEQASPGTVVFAGALRPELRCLCAVRDLPCYDLLDRENFVRRNAALTAEAALALLAEGPEAVYGKRVLVAGCGRVGRALISRLLALEARVTAAARRPEDRAWAALQGCHAVSLAEAPAPDYDAAVNTIPYPVFGREALERFGGVPLLELASAPYGFDAAAARALGKPLRLLPGLPGRYAPEAAAAAIRDEILSILEERDHA